MRKIIASILIALLASSLCLSLVGCADDPADNGGNTGDYLYDPYYNRFKPDAPGGAPISVVGKDFYFEEVEIRDKNEEKQVNDERSLRKLYSGVFVRFAAEDTVEFVDYSHFFSVPETKGVREGNVLTVQATNKTGDYTYDIRIEIHEDKILVIHNLHHHNEPCTYATITFSCEE